MGWGSEIWDPEKTYLDPESLGLNQVLTIFLFPSFPSDSSSTQHSTIWSPFLSPHINSCTL